MAMNAFYMGNGIGKRHGQAFITKVDKHGSKHWTDNNCPKCGGTGYLPGYEHVDGARCWKCGATGFHPHHWVERTPEYQAVLDAKRQEKARKKNLAERAEYFKSEGFDEFGVTYVATGDTFAIKDELKEKGFKFNRQLGWHIPYMVGSVECIEVGYELVMWENSIGRLYYKDDAKELVDAKRPQELKSESNFVGDVGGKVEVELILDFCFAIEGFYGTSYINKLKDANGNIFIWKTGRQIAELNAKVVLKGTIKEHSEYRGEKQTVLTRCKEVA